MPSQFLSEPPHFIIVQQKLAPGDGEVLLSQCNDMFCFFCLSIPLCSIWVSFNARRWGELHAWVLGRSSCFPWISHAVHFNLASAMFHGVTARFGRDLRDHPVPSFAMGRDTFPSPSSCDSVILCGNGLFSSFPCHSFSQPPKHYQTLDFGKEG